VILYPNPAQSSEDVYIRLRTDKSTQAYGTISDVSGKIFFTGPMDLSTDVNINKLRLTHNLSKGFYVIHVVGSNFKETLKLIIQ
jgi:hypothetical protein